MPADFDTSATFSKMVLELALEVGLAEYDQNTGKAVLPSDPEALRLCKARVNEGLQRFARAYPKWSKLEHRVQIKFYPNGDGPLNINNEAHRYRLPPFVASVPRNNWQYVDVTSPYIEVIHTNYDMVQRMMTASSLTNGVPYYAATRQYEPESGDDRQGYEVIFYPSPSQTLTVEAEFRVVVHELIEDDDKHPFGAEHDLAILKCAVEAFRRRDDEDPAAYQRAKEDMIEAINESIRLDQMLNTPRSLGPLKDPSVVQSPINPRLLSYPTDFYVNGVNVANTP